MMLRHTLLEQIETGIQGEERRRRAPLPCYGAQSTSTRNKNLKDDAHACGSRRTTFCQPIHPTQPPPYTDFVAVQQLHLTSSVISSCFGALAEATDAVVLLGKKLSTYLAKLIIVWRLPVYLDEARD